MDVLYYQKKYKQMLERRDITWRLLDKEDFREEWFITRPRPHQWAIDEILRHILANEIRYVQIPLDPGIEQHEISVKAQWVGEILFRLEETSHRSAEEVKSAFHGIEETSGEMMDRLTSPQLDLKVKAPWGEMLQYKDMLADLFDHTQFHRGQIHFLVTYFGGPPKFEKPPDDVNFG